MKRLIVIVVSLVVVILLLLAPGLVSDTSGSTTDSDFTISSYKAVMDVDENGDLSVDEVLKIDFVVSGKHGIFRFWDRVTRTPRTLDVPRTASRSRWTARRCPSRSARRPRPRPGREDRRPCPHPDARRAHLRHHYEIDGVLEQGTTGQPRQQFYWNLIPGGWLQNIDKADLTVHLPVNSRATSSARSATGDRRLHGAGRRHQGPHRHDRPAAPAHPGHGRPPWTCRPRPSGDQCRGPARWDRGPRPQPVRSLLVLVLRPRRGRGARRAAGRPLAREGVPPSRCSTRRRTGIGPAQAKYIYSEDVDNDHTSRR